MLNRTFGCVRLVWNKALSERHQRHRTKNASTSYRATDAALTAWKRTEELGFLSEVSSVPLQQTLRHQHSAFQNFFAGRARRPRFKSRAGRQVVVSREPDGRWYVTFAVETDPPPTAEPAAHAVGIDLGLTNFLVTSDGVRITSPQRLARKARNLSRYQRRLARCERGSMNRRKAKAKLARAHRKVRNAREDFLHRTTTALVRSADLIAIEDLNVAGMVRNRHLARAISGAAWGEFRRQLEYKCARAGRTLVVIDRWYPSSKTCSACGHVLAELSLAIRRWACPNCRTRHDRDLNAAKNILAAGRAVARGDSGDACGADVRRQGSSLPRSAMKQENPAARPGG